MKRLTIIALVLAGLTVVCMGAYKSRGSPLKVVKLPQPQLTGAVSLEQALGMRRSVRRFSNQELDLIQIGQLAWAGQGITDKQKGFRTAPSAGAIYPIILYFATQEGVFVYNPDQHSLEQIVREDVRSTLAKASGQEPAAEAACDIIIAGEARKLAGKYKDRARRYMLLESGHIAQNILLQAVSLGLGSVPIGAFDVNQVRKVCKLPVALDPVYIICVGYPARPEPIKEEEKETRKIETVKVKKAVLVIASSNFRDEELFQTKRALDAAGIQTVIASTKKAVIKGMLGGRAEATMLVNEVSIDDYDAIIFIGGSGAKEYFANPVALNIAHEAAKKGKILAAICIAPTVLANAGVLNDIKATSFPSERIKLQKAGAQYSGAAVVRDGLIITASGPEVASQFGQAIAQTLTGR